MIVRTYIATMITNDGEAELYRLGATSPASAHTAAEYLAPTGWQVVRVIESPDWEDKA